MAAITQSRHTAYSDFPVGTRVEVVAESQDFSFFNRDRGVVTENKGRYLGILVQFDRPRAYHLCGRHAVKDCPHPVPATSNFAWDVRDPFIFNFNPEDLMIEGEVFEQVTSKEEPSFFGARRRRMTTGGSTDAMDSR